jgi:hypothetical protein
MRLCGLDWLPTEQKLLAIAACRRPYRSLAVGYLFLLELEFLSEFEAKP